MEASSCNGSVVSGGGGSSGQSSLGSAVESSSSTLHPARSSEQQSLIQGRSVLHQQQQQQPYPGQQHPSSSSSSSTVTIQAERCNVGRSSGADDRSARMPRSDRQSGGAHQGPHQTLTRGGDPTTTTAAHVTGSTRNYETGSGKAAKNIKVEPNEGTGSNPRDSIHPTKIGHGSSTAINVASNMLRSGSGVVGAANCISSMSMMGDNSAAHSQHQQHQQQQLAASGVLDVLGNGLAMPSLVSAGFDPGLGSCSDGLIDPLTGLGRVGFDPALHHSATQWFTNQSPFVPRGGSSSGGGQDLYHRLSIACPESSALQGEACSLQGYPGSASATGPCAWYGPPPPPSTGDMSNGCQVNYGALSPVLDVFDAAAVSRIRSPSSSANQLPQHLARQSCQLSSSFRSGVYYPPTGSYAAYASENDCASKF